MVNSGMGGFFNSLINLLNEANFCLLLGHPEQQMGNHSLEWNWPKEAMSIPFGAGIVARAKLF